MGDVFPDGASKVWLGPPPDKCDICEAKIKDSFVDGKTHMGPWACMCIECHEVEGVGFGMGKGQLFRRSLKDRKFYVTKGWL